jgi:hypothetical protein
MAARETVPVVLMTVVFLLLMAGAGAFVLLRQTASNPFGAGGPGGAGGIPGGAAGGSGNPNIDAIERISAEIAADPRSADAYLRRGHVYARVDDYYSATTRPPSNSARRRKPLTTRGRSHTGRRAKTTPPSPTTTACWRSIPTTLPPSFHAASFTGR